MEYIEGRCSSPIGTPFRNPFTAQSPADEQKNTRDLVNFFYEYIDMNHCNFYISQNIMSPGSSTKLFSYKNFEGIK